jgi:hypothetical protein
MRYAMTPRPPSSEGGNQVSVAETGLKERAPVVHDRFDGGPGTEGRRVIVKGLDGALLPASFDATARYRSSDARGRGPSVIDSGVGTSAPTPALFAATERDESNVAVAVLSRLRRGTAKRSSRTKIALSIDQSAANAGGVAFPTRFAVHSAAF